MTFYAVLAVRILWWGLILVGPARSSSACSAGGASRADRINSVFCRGRSDAGSWANRIHGSALTRVADQ